MECSSESRTAHVKPSRSPRVTRRMGREYTSLDGAAVLGGFGERHGERRDGLRQLAEADHHGALFVPQAQARATQAVAQREPGDALHLGVLVEGLLEPVVRNAAR